MASNSPRNREYFITINKGCECYDHIQEIIDTLKYKIYAYITHDKDYILNENGDMELKKEHKHLMIELENALTFNSIQNKFKGAHIEVPKYKKSAYQYLIHNRPNARDKYQYDFTDIITSSPKELKDIIESEDCELFRETMFLEYIADGTITQYQFVKRFGLNAYKQYWSVYNVMIEQLNTDKEMIEDFNKILEERKENELPF